MPYNSRYFLFFLCLTAVILVNANPHFPTPAGKADILIVSPHPDDAVLCCTGLILQALEQKKRVHIVEMTDGDGYADAAALLAGKTTGLLAPIDMRRLGRIRQHEEIRAMQTLSLNRNHITFLGYPDGWLDEVYNTRDEPFRSSFTGISTARHSGRPYIKQSVIADIQTILKQTRPTGIYVSGLSDTALDHQVTYRFMSDALTASGYTGNLFTYTNHTSEENADITPAYTVQLTHDQVQKKTAAIASHASQLSLDGVYLHSFASGEEIFY